MTPLPSLDVSKVPFVVSEEFCGKSKPNMFVLPACILMMETTASCTFSTAAVVSVVTLTATSVTVSFTVGFPVSPVPDPLPRMPEPKSKPAPIKATIPPPINPPTMPFLIGEFLRSFGRLDDASFSLTLLYTRARSSLFIVGLVLAVGSTTDSSSLAVSSTSVYSASISVASDKSSCM